VGRSTLWGVASVKDSALGHVARGERAIVLKVSEATDLDSAGANDLVALAATMRVKNVAFALAGPYPTQILNSVVSYGVNTTVAMFSSAEEAILMVSAANPGTLQRAQENFNRQPFRHSRELPEKIRRIYDETFMALAYGLPVLAGIGIRTLVEGVCKDVNDESGTLEQRINSLIESDVLTKTGAAILHRTRFLGNRAAHEVEPPTLEQLNAALDVAEHLLTSVYVMRRAASTLPTGRRGPSNEN
jgi:anti-anti-sigma regulatory factor